MVPPKATTVDGIRILDESKTSMNMRGFKGQRKECTAISKLSRDAGRISVSRKPPLINVYANSKKQIDLENDRGKMKSGRKALADISNLNNRRSLPCTNQLSTKPKLINNRNKQSNMAPLKDRAVDGIQILDDSKTSMNVRGFKVQGKECAAMSKLSRDIGRSSLSRKPLLFNVSANSKNQIDLENNRKGKMKSGREALADICNLNNRRSLPCINQLSSKPKPMNLKDNGTKKVTLEGSKMSRGFGRLSLAKGITVADLSLTKSMRNSSKLRTSVMTRHAYISKKLETAKRSVNKDLEEPGTSNSCENSKVSKEVLLGLNGSYFLNDIVKSKCVSRCKCNRRKSYTFSLVIRRNCDGLMKNDLLANIDDITNPLEVADYVDDIYQYYWTMEVERPTISKYTEIQSDVTPKMRSILVNWLIEVHHKYKLMEESLFLMIELLDRLLSTVNIKKNELQLFGLTTLLLASKFEDYWHPKVGELISLLIDQFTKDEMLGMEIFILKKLQFRLNVPTPYVFMLRFLRAAQSDKKVEDLSFYLIELCLVENESLEYKPSLLCASAIFVVRSSLRLNPPWTGLLRKHARYEESELRNCAEMILRFQRTAAYCKPVKYTYLKYLEPDRSCAASLKPMKMLPL